MPDRPANFPLPNARATDPSVDPRHPSAPHFEVPLALQPADAVSLLSSSARPPAVRQTWRHSLRGIAVMYAGELKTFLLRPTSSGLLLAAAALARLNFSFPPTLPSPHTSSPPL